MACDRCGGSGKMTCPACGGSRTGPDTHGVTGPGNANGGRCVRCDGKGTLKCGVCGGAPGSVGRLGS